VPRAFAGLRRSIRFAPPALTALVVAMVPLRARGEEPQPEAEPVEIVVTGAPGRRAPPRRSPP